MRASYIEDFEKWSSEFTYAAPLTVRFADLDMYGIVNNAVIISYLEYARIEYFKHLGLMMDWVDIGNPVAPVLADIQCDYVKPIEYDEQLQIGVKVEKIGTSSVDIHYLGRNSKEEILFIGRSTMVQIDKKTGKGSPWSDNEKIVILTSMGNRRHDPHHFHIF